MLAPRLNQLNFHHCRPAPSLLAARVSVRGIRSHFKTTLPPNNADKKAQMMSLHSRCSLSPRYGNDPLATAIETTAVVVATVGGRSSRTLRMTADEWGAGDDTCLTSVLGQDVHLRPADLLCFHRSVDSSAFSCSGNSFWHLSKEIRD